MPLRSVRKQPQTRQSRPGETGQTKRVMITFFRNFFQSRLGIALTLGFLALIAFAFASGDLANIGAFGGVTGDDRVAAVGDQRISTSDLSNEASNRVSQMREQDPRVSIESFVAQGGLDDVLEQMLSRWAVAEFAEELGLRAGDRLIDSEIVQIPAFRGLDGKFSEEVYRAALNQRGLSEAMVRGDFAKGLLARQLITPAVLGASMPATLASRYARLLAEKRSGLLAALPAAAFAPQGQPDEAQLQAFYTANSASFILPERRVLRYALIDQTALGDLPAPTPAQIARAYERNRAAYQPVERRVLTQLVLPTQAAAQAIVQEVAAGATLEGAAQAKGLATSKVDGADRASLGTNASAAVADAAFAAAPGRLSVPARGSLGWYVLRVDEVIAQPGLTLAQASPQIAQELAQQQRREAFTRITSGIDEAIAAGSSLAEVAKDFGLTLEVTEPLLGTGQSFQTGAPAPPVLGPVLALAFEMGEGAPQLADVGTGDTYLAFEVAEITEAAAPALAEIRDQVVMAWRRDRGMAAAGEAAGRVLARVNQGQALAAAMAAETVALPAVEEVTLSRQDIAQMAQVTPATVLFFSMAQGTTKRLEQAVSDRWFVIQLDRIEAPELAADDPILAQTKAELSGIAGDEYGDQLVAALRAGVKIEVNQGAVAALRAQLAGQAQ